MKISYNYTEYAPDKDTAIDNVRRRVSPKMKNWNFSATLAENSGNDKL